MENAAQDYLTGLGGKLSGHESNRADMANDKASITKATGGDHNYGGIQGCYPGGI